MSIFTNILHKIFHTQTAQAAPTATAQAAPTASAAPTPAPAAAPAAAPVDVEAILTDLSAQNPQPLNWRNSIVDLLKLLNLDSGPTARKELAHELHFSGDPNDSAAMNIWLIKAVMKKLADNGGRVPADLMA
jgi:hypothetical protein